MPHYETDGHDPPSASFVKPTPAPPRHLPREPRPSRPVRLHRYGRTQSHPAQPIHGIPGPATAAQGVAERVPPVSPSVGFSPMTESGLLPGGGVQVPPGFRFTEPDQGRYRTRNRDLEEGDFGEPKVLGGMGLGVFKGLKKLPKAIVKAGRSYGPRTQDKRDSSSLPETGPEQIRREVPIQYMQDEVETYQEHEEDEAAVPEEQLIREYVQRRRMRRDRAHRHRSRRDRVPNYVPAPQPVLVPGTRTSAVSAVASQAGHSQAGRSDHPPPSLEAQLEAEEIEHEREALAQAQAQERARHVYAADAVRAPTSSASSQPPFVGHESSANHRRAASEPGLSNRVYSRWAAERDVTGRRLANRSDQAAGTPSTSPLSLSNLRRFIQQIRDMPWVGDRVAADYIPGGVKREPSHYYLSSPRSDSTFTSLNIPGTANGVRMPSSDVSAHSVARVDSNPGQSWYAPRDEMLVLPLGVAPPPGFVPYHGPYLQDRGSVDGDGPSSTSSHTHVEGSAAPSMPAMPVPVAAGTGLGPTYVNGSKAYHYMPAEASATGQPYIFVPTPGGHQPLFVPEGGLR